MILGGWYGDIKIRKAAMDYATNIYTLCLYKEDRFDIELVIDRTKGSLKVSGYHYSRCDDEITKFQIKEIIGINGTFET